MQRERPSRRQLLIRRTVCGVLATALVTAVGSWAVHRGTGGSSGDGAEVRADQEAPGPAVTTTTTTPARPTVVADPMALTVLVNKIWRLPPGWEPPDLVEPNVPFTFAGPDPKRSLRSPAAAALESLFAAATAAGHPLAAVSGYRSEQKQAELFARAVSEQGVAQAELHSARPGHSEHQTGLAVDITGADGSCAVEACFAATPAGAWVADHAARHGFLVRYPEDKAAITGYDYEPWHLRFVGVEAATFLEDRGLVLEELPG